MQKSVGLSGLSVPQREAVASPMCPLLLQESEFNGGTLVPAVDPDGTSKDSWDLGVAKIIVPPLSNAADECHVEMVQPQVLDQDNFLPVVVLASSLDGLSLLRSLLEWDKVLVVGVVTDNVTDEKAKIGPRKKRWPSGFTDEECKGIQQAIIDTSVSAGVSVFLGGVNEATEKGQVDFIRDIIPRMIEMSGRYHSIKPTELVDCLGVMCTFGQVLKQHVLDASVFQKYGIVNVHPSDLMNDIGAGPSSQVVASANDGRLPVAIHYALPEVDASEALILQTGRVIELPSLEEVDPGICPDIRRLELATPGHSIAPLRLVIEAKLQSGGRVRGELSS